MGFDAKVLAHSIDSNITHPLYPDGVPLLSMELTFPRSVHAEFMTHRVYSRNAASSRAIPEGKLISDIVEDPYLPIYWGSAQKGMQAGDALPAEIQAQMNQLTLQGLDAMVFLTSALSDLGGHKQDINRYVEPWMYIKVIVTGTEWNNFYSLRKHSAAHPGIRKIAEIAHEVASASTPKQLKEGDWHLPLWGFEGDEKLDGNELYRVEDEDGNVFYLPLKVLVAVGRCARVSYLTHDGRRDITADIALAVDNLAKNGHYSPWEHIAMAMPRHEWALRDQLARTLSQHAMKFSLPDTSDQLYFSGNFRGWHQARKMFKPESGVSRELQVY